MTPRPASFEFKNVRVSFDGGRMSPERAERITRMTLARVSELLAGAAPVQARGGSVVKLLEVGPVRASFATTGDEAVARAAAAEIGRALLRALEG